MHLALPLAFLIVQGLVFALLPSVSAAAAYVAMVAAPLLAAMACVWRMRRETPAARPGWALLAVALLLWALGAASNLWHELVLGLANQMYRSAMLAFNLSVVPVAFLLASDWWPEARRSVLTIDAVLALALGHGFFLTTWAMLTVLGGTDPSTLVLMVWLLDLQIALIVAGALLRWRVAQDAAERSLFGALAVYQALYFVVLVANNHYIAPNPAYGPQESSIVTVSFAALAVFALRKPAPAGGRVPNAALARAVKSIRPFVLPAALLIVSLFLIRVDYAWGVAGVLIAVVGHGLRHALAEVRYLERGELLQRERSELQSIAWTDALTGVPNRRAFDQALRGAARREARNGSPLAVLMIDIDHFKRFNDHEGHVRGDDCLREVAQLLQQALARPGDMLARYGGEEFIALLHGADAAGAQVVGERLRAAVEVRRIAHADSPQRIVTISVGVASARVNDAADALRLVEAADRSLYEAKCAGRNRLGVAEVDAV